MKVNQIMKKEKLRFHGGILIERGKNIGDISCVTCGDTFSKHSCNGSEVIKTASCTKCNLRRTIFKPFIRSRSRQADEYHTLYLMNDSLTIRVKGDLDYTFLSELELPTMEVLQRNFKHYTSYIGDGFYETVFELDTPGVDKKGLYKVFNESGGWDYRTIFTKDTERPEGVYAKLTYGKALKELRDLDNKIDYLKDCRRLMVNRIEEYEQSYPSHMFDIKKGRYNVNH